MTLGAVTNQANASPAVPPQNTVSVNTRDSEAAQSSGRQEDLVRQAPRTNLGNPAIYRISLSGNGRNAAPDVKRETVVNGGTAPRPSPVANNTVVFKRDANNRLVMQVIDKKTDKVLKQYPPEEMQRIGRALDKFLASQKSQNSTTFAGVA